ncbi:hypothetical protein Salat_1603700 [Sesamum alatum]|uniref:Uncharacterized protein n=1 Tax=Sesamum alatum TaxID=300844 RepID=A0AAE1Y5M1_9LAMI|nr:hypothetical protein Salat_1603700 [Sesamum alatum]
MPSAEDVAWADSCLTKDPEVLDNGWDSMKEALLETLSVQHYSSAHEEDKFSEQPKMETSSSSEMTDDVSTTASNGEAEPSNSDQSTNEKTDDFWSRHNMEDVFLPTYSESFSNVETSDTNEDLFVQELQMDLSTDDIFKVWDLNVSPEEDDNLTKQLHKALEQSSSEATTSVSDHSEAWKGSHDESVDDLISGIADLSLSPTSG